LANKSYIILLFSPTLFEKLLNYQKIYAIINYHIKKRRIIKMNKKFFALTAAAVLSVSLLAGCGGGETAPKKTIASIDDLNGATIGVQLGTTGDIYATDVEGATVEQYTKGADAVQALKQNKIDCVIIDKEPAKKFVEANEGLKILEEDFVTEEYAICIAKDKAELKDKINTALAEIKAEGTLDSIVANYIGDDTKGKSPYKSPENVDRSNGTLKMVTNAEFEPYEYMENEKIIGIDVDLAQAICDKLGMTLEIENIGFDAIINAVQSGKADVGVAGLTITEDRLESIDFTEPYTTATQVIIVNE
jgi:polar amino acid transport system substrate-binding protein